MIMLFLNQFEWYRKWSAGEWFMFQYYDEFIHPLIDPAHPCLNLKYIWRKGSETAGETEKIGKWILYKIMKSEDWDAKIIK